MKPINFKPTSNAAPKEPRAGSKMAHVIGIQSRNDRRRLTRLAKAMESHDGGECSVQETHPATLHLTPEPATASSKRPRTVKRSSVR